MPWYWVGAAGSGGVGFHNFDSSFGVQSVGSQDGLGVTEAAVLSFTDLGNPEGIMGLWLGWEIPPATSLANGQGLLGNLTFSFDALVSGTEFANATTPVSIEFDQYAEGLDAFYTFWGSISPTITTDGNWNHVSFTLDQLTPVAGDGFSFFDYDNQLGFQIIIFSNTDNNGADLQNGDTAVIELDNLLLTSDLPIVPAPEPGTITLLTLGGLGALVAIRRRRA